MTGERDGLARSVQVRLARHAKEIGADPNLVLMRFAVERLREAIWQLNLAVLEAAPANIRQNRIMQIERSANP
jgi:dihydrodipicolinate synthase/N-acetylneuraminate lyase